MKPRKLDVSYSQTDQISPIGTRYTTPMSKIFNDDSYIQALLDVEAENAKALSEFYPKKVPKSAASRIKSIANTRKVTPREVRKIEAEKTHHEMGALISLAAKKAGPAGRYVHFAMTSADAIETAKAMQTKRALDLLIKTASQARDACLKAAFEWKSIPAITRTHGQHAIPAAFGLPFAFFGYSLQKSIDRLKSDRENYVEGKLSGVIGTYDVHTSEGMDGMAIEAKVLSSLKIKKSEMTMQTPPREDLAYIISDLAVLCGRLATIASYIKTLKRTEVQELVEMPEEGSIGSSAMPHKSIHGNPFIEERCISIGRVARGHALTALESMATEDFRDLTASLSDRIALPESFILSDYSCMLVKNLIERSSPLEENIRRNLNHTKGVTASQLVMSKLIEKGMPRHKARQLSANAAQRSLASGMDYLESLIGEREISRLVSKEELKLLCDPRSNMGKSVEIIERIVRKYKGMR